MRPALKGYADRDIEVDAQGNAVLDDADVPKYVSAFQTDPEFWSQHGGRLNPWHENLDHIMFYL